MLGIAFDRLDHSAGAMSQAERRMAEAGSDLENPLSRDSRRKHGEKRAAGRGVHAAARSVGFVMLMRRECSKGSRWRWAIWIHCATLSAEVGSARLA
jgi:hypothetical protein